MFPEEAHLSSGIAVIRLGGGVRDDGGGPRATMVRGGSLGFVVAVGPRYTQ